MKVQKRKEGIGRLVIPHLRPVSAFADKVTYVFQVRFCPTKRQGQAMAFDVITINIS